MVDANTSPSIDLHEAAQTKLVRVLGPSHGRVVFAEALKGVGLDRIHTADQLFRLGQHLEARGGFAATVGALLCLTAVMHGAAGRRL